MADTARTNHQDTTGRDQYGKDQQYGRDQLYGKGQYGGDQYGRDPYGRDQYGRLQYGQDQYQISSGSYYKAKQIAKGVSAVTAGGSLLVLSSLILVGTVIALTIATPLLVIFSPILVPAVITVALLITGFLSSGGFGIAAITVFSWMYKYLTGEQPQWSDRLDSARMKLGSKAQDLKDRAQYYGQQHTGGEHDRDREHRTARGNHHNA